MTNSHLQPASRIRPPRILIVEDEPVIARMVEEFVRELGYTVSSVARTAAMARLHIAHRNFDAVLLDINLGGGYHLETADVLLEAGIPFAFVTGYDYVLEPRHEGVPLLEKPFGSDRPPKSLRPHKHGARLKSASPNLCHRRPANVCFGS